MKIQVPSDGRVVFSTYRGLTASGEGALARLDPAALLEFRKLPRFEVRRPNSIGIFVRSVIINRYPGRLLGAFRVAPDSSARSGYYGYAVCCLGRNLNALNSALGSLNEIKEMDVEEDIQRLTAGQTFPGFSIAERGQSVIVERYQGVNDALLFGIEEDAQFVAIIPTLWYLSWMDDNHDTFVAFSDHREEPVLSERNIQEIESTYVSRFENRNSSKSGRSGVSATGTTGAPPRLINPEATEHSRGRMPASVSKRQNRSIPDENVDSGLESHEQAISMLSHRLFELEREVSKLRSRVYSLSQNNSSVRKGFFGQGYSNHDGENIPWGKIILIGAIVLAGAITLGTVSFLVLSFGNWI
jgi:hypothetical protein